MLGLGWSEMLVLSVVVLIVVGPKDLPMMLRNIGRMMGSVRRMSNEFRREIDKAIALDEVKEARKAISDPLRQTSDEIAREFNTFKDGKVSPSGKLKPDEPGKESVAEEIRKQAGLPQRKDTKAENAASETAARKAPAKSVKPQAGKSTATKSNTKPTASKSAAKSTEKPATRAGTGKTAKPAAKPAAKKVPARKKTTARPKAETGAGDSTS